MAAPVADFTVALITVTSWHLQFTDLSTNAPTSWAWDFGDGGTSTAQNPIHDYSTPGTFTVTLIATNADGSDSEVKVDYIFMGAFFPEFSATPLTGTEPLLVAFTDLTPGSPSSWAWNFGDGGTSFLQNPTHNYASAGTYNPYLVAGNGSSGALQKMGYVVVAAAPPGGDGDGGGPATGLYVTHGGFGASNTNLYSLDPDTMTLTAVGDTGHFFTGLAVDPTDSTKLYGVTGNLGTGQRTLYRINADTGGVTSVGALGTTIADIAFDASGQLYGFKASSRRLCTIDKTTGAVVEVGSSGLGGTNGNGIAVDPVDDNKVWLFPQGGAGDIFTMNKTTGAATNVGTMFPTVSAGQSIGAASFDPDGVLWGLGTEGKLFTIGTPNVDDEYPQTLVGTLAGDEPWDGMAWAPSAPTPPPDPPATAYQRIYGWDTMIDDNSVETVQVLTSFDGGAS